MAYQIQTLSFSQFSELMAIEPKRLIGIRVHRLKQTVDILLEPEDAGATVSVRQTKGAVSGPAGSRESGSRS